MTEYEFDALLGGVLERPVRDMSNQELERRITVTQAATDVLLNEIERRGLLWVSQQGVPILPYLAPDSRHVETILTRPSH